MRINFYRNGDFLCCYGAHASTVAKYLGLTLQRVSERHATPIHPVGTLATAIPLHRKALDFAALQQAGHEPDIVGVVVYDPPSPRVTVAARKAASR